MNIPVGLTAIQEQFKKDSTRFKIVTSGRRSRKTLLSRWQLQKYAMLHKGRYFLGAPTHQQAKAIFWDALKSDMRLFTRDINETALKIKLINGSEIQVIGLMAGERVEGQVWHACVITEFDDVPVGVWEEHIRPVLSDTLGWAILEGVPEGRAALYELALKICNGSIPKTIPIEGAYHKGQNYGPDDDWSEWAFYTWFSSDVLTPAEIAAARSTMDQRTFEQEYQGAFGSSEGQAYYAFGEHNYNRDLFRDQRAPVYVGIDFNVNPMTAVLCHVDQRRRIVFQWGELYLQNSNTFEMCDEICRTLGIESGHGVTVIPDATGGAQSSNSTVSDLAILRKRGFDVLTRTANPFQRDRLAAVNSMLRTSSGDVHYYINPASCPQTVRDFNRVQLLPDGRIDKSLEKKGIGHISDALGYLINHYFPVRQRSVTAV
ncbi:MAG TPA: hypothetical protein VLH56_11280 [Dissulfurispiraceae bacterium]|nr:hypothetical protein [Dissulfurispiraceae bacterium]